MGAQFCCTQQSHQIVKLQPIPLSKKSRSTPNSPEIKALIRHTVVQDHQELSLQDFEKLSQLGHGGFAIVYLVQMKQNMKKNIKIRYAMKQIQKKKIFERRVVESVKLEKKVLAQLRNNFIISLFYSFQDSYNCYFIMQYAQGGDLYGFLNNKKQPNKVKQFKMLGEFAIKFIVGCVILSLEVLHKHSIMYRDLKPQNVLIFQNGYPKLADFGLAKIASNEVSKTMAGTKIYFAPEILQQKGYTRSVDFWTLGIFIYQLLVFEPPFEHRVILKGKFKNICQEAQECRDWKGANLSQSAKDIINLFLKVDPQKRLGMNGFDQIKNHSFFKQLDWNKLEKMQYPSPIINLVKKYPLNPKKIIPQTQNTDMLTFDNIASFTFKKALNQ